MSVRCSSRLAIPTLSAHSHRRRSGLSVLKRLTTTATKSPSRAATKAPGAAAVQDLSAQQKEQISLYVSTLLQWNQRMNLTAVTEEGEAMTRHVEDSLAILPPLRRAYLSRCCSASSCEGLNVVDVGSGPGLPGLIFAIACPSWKLTLVESMHKRCLFLEHVIGLTGLSNVQILHERAEIHKRFHCILWGPFGLLKKPFLIAKNVGQSLDFRESFDVAVARAVAEMRTLAEYCLPLVRVGGLFVAAKGSDPQEEVKSAENAIRLMGASILELCTVASHSPFGQRTAVICLKDRATPSKYPRQPGIPSKTPL